MTETNEERLERLQSLGVDPQTTVWDMGENDLVWLIEQAERAQGLERIIETHAPEGRNYTNAQHVEMLQENERLREALEEVFELSKHDNQSRYLDKCYVVARQTLEGTK